MKRAGDRFGRLFFYDIFEQKSQPLTHESSSVGARPSSDAPLRTVPWQIGNGTCVRRGAAPTEELSCVRTGLLIDGATEDGRAFGRW
jgi:hypothetical protein